MTAYYNEIDRNAAAWLRELIRVGVVAPGDVDERSIVDVQPADLVGYTQCHFFAGIGVWSYALRLAGWPDDRPVWTGSCPCQPFSSAGKGEGFNDPRHLWPAWFRLIRECRPVGVFGEQVESAVRHGWLDVVSADLEAEGYAIGSALLGAHSVGAPHIRQRVYFVADTDRRGAGEYARELHDDEGQHEVRASGGNHASVDRSPAGAMAVTDRDGRRVIGATHDDNRRLAPRHDADRLGTTGELGDTEDERRKRAEAIRRQAGDDGNESGRIGAIETRPVAEAGRTRSFGFWSDAEWINCTDGKARPVEPGTFPLAHGAAFRVVRLRGYGNAIVGQAAEAFIRAYLDVRGG